MAGSWDTDLKLVALAGDVEPGMTVPLDPERTLAIGRSAKGMQLPDPLVSIHHAQIGFEERRGYYVKDLDSATGTWVDEELIQNDSRPIGIGTRLRFGDTTFEVQVRRRFPPWVSYVMAGTILLCLIAMAGWFLAGLREPPPPLLGFSEPIHQSATFSSPLLLVPPEFARERGLVVTDLRIRRVTDWDYDGIDEVWLREGTTREFLVTFETDGRWRSMGEFPVDCHDESDSFRPAEVFPALDCKGVTYMLIDGAYRPRSHDGVVVWTRPPAPVDEEPAPGEEAAGGEPEGALPPGVILPDVPLKPLRVVLREPARMAGFLAEHGINEPVHYLICEDAFPRIKPQVLTAMGQIKPLVYGCVRHINLSDRSEGRPVAVAFTAHGREALLADVASFYGGSPEMVFGDEQRELVEAARRSPGYERGALKLTAEGMQVFVDPIAQERPLGTGRTLISKDQRNPASQPATVATITSAGVAELDPEGCALLRVKTEEFLCFGLCRGGSTFLSIEEVGCGEPRELLSIPYSGGVEEVEVEGIQVRAAVDSGTEAARYKVARARVAWRAKGR
jgi:hypothetical protein